MLSIVLVATSLWFIEFYNMKWKPCEVIWIDSLLLYPCKICVGSTWNTEGSAVQDQTIA